jgi:hypothetical protein
MDTALSAPHAALLLAQRMLNSRAAMMLQSLLRP